MERDESVKKSRRKSRSEKKRIYYFKIERKWDEKKGFSVLLTSAVFFVPVLQYDTTMLQHETLCSLQSDIFSSNTKWSYINFTRYSFLFSLDISTKLKKNTQKKNECVAKIHQQHQCNNTWLWCAFYHRIQKKQNRSRNNRFFPSPPIFVMCMRACCCCFF